MRYKSYVVSYIGENVKVNNDNFYLNGICKESVDDPFVCDENKEFTSRNIYALASGWKSDAIGDELAYIACDLLRNFHVADFDSVNREFFHVANTAITSQVLDRNDEFYSVDLSVLAIDRDVATVYNMGAVPVFFYDGGKLRNLAGKAPESVELAKDYLDNYGEVKTKVYSVRNVSHIGELSSDMEVVPYTSEKIKMRKKSYFVMCSPAVMDVIDESVIEEILGDKTVKTKNKALAILDKAIKVNPDGNYTVEVVVAGHGLAIAEKELISMARWFVVALVCLLICINSSVVLGFVSNIIDGCKSFIQEHFGEEQVETVDIYRKDKSEDNDASGSEDAPFGQESDLNMDEETTDENQDGEDESAEQNESNEDETSEERQNSSDGSQSGEATAPRPTNQSSASTGGAGSNSQNSNQGQQPEASQSGNNDQGGQTSNSGSQNQVAQENVSDSEGTSSTSPEQSSAQAPVYMAGDNELPFDI